MPKTKQIIKDVLDDCADSQMNLGSDTARETLSRLITVALMEWGQPESLPNIKVTYEIVD